jgi:hypothetical protein
MNIFNLIRQSYIKFIRELFIIFISIVLAFLFDDYREFKNEKSSYKETLANFRDELLSDLNGSALDSFRISTDNSTRGWKFERLLNLLWLDSLIDAKKATMADFRFIIKEYLYTETFSGQEPSPLAKEIRTKFSEHVKSKLTLNQLNIYEAEKKNLLAQRSYLEKHQERLDDMISKTNPYYNFTKQDSLLFYSNEFIWRYKDIVDARKGEYRYERWLIQNRYRKVFNAVNKEMELIGLPMSGELKCILVAGFYKRFECENGRRINNGDSLNSIKHIVEQDRQTNKSH